MNVSEGVKVWLGEHDIASRWDMGRSVGSGGQRRGFEAFRKGEQPPIRRFAKVLKDQSNPVRRARMFREAAALASYNHPRLPRLIESNAHLHSERDARLYLVTDFVASETLATRHRAPLPFEEALELTDQLADAVAYLQANEAVHRDIKPDNIIMGEGRTDAVLVDHALTFNRREPSRPMTGDWEELGNRFLRLPELASYSGAKQDLRTDIAFLTGILFFCLTGEAPAVLEDGEGRLPHQRGSVDLVQFAPDADRARSIARLFDRGFQPRLTDRFPTVKAFRFALSQLRLASAEILDQFDLMTRAGLLRGGEGAARYRRRTQALDEVWHWIDKSVRALQVFTGGNYVVTSSGDYEPGSDRPYRNIGLHHHHRGALSRYWLRFTCHFVGNELVVTAAEEDGTAEEEVLRTAVDHLNLDFGGDQRIQARLVVGLESLSTI